ncbi:mycofactocin biosynthesis peptidyl-dipeptidase MftE [Saccharopolyspora erythraea]|nr:mycofactocin biosynthesis peptidyl-dipeptidase MftE [Saccharopolyspora erythraea]QUH05988.1 mycofactocin biosynthesis peptidyl-dipeptidase MftE [Saccharopolyspora erythraea]
MNLASMCWPQLHSARFLLAVPLGATEQHGPHLPLDTDTAIAEELCRRLAERRPDVLVAPALPYGSSGEHAAFPGTLSIGQTAVELVLTELVRSADAFTGVIIVNGHGGNLEPVRAAMRTLHGEGRRALTWTPDGPADDSHAGRTETSAMLHMHPDQVDHAAAEPGTTAPLPQLMRLLRAGGVAAVSPNGVLGDPTGATAEQGTVLLDRWTDQLVAAVEQWHRR